MSEHLKKNKYPNHKMGLYAFFSTGLEYKFGFGTQESSDIRRFGGIITHEPGYYCHTWSNTKDREYIKEQLNSLIKYSDIKLPDFSKYEHTLNGTYALKEYFYENSEKMYREIGDRLDTLKLGCLIYHQLQYTPELYVRYE